MVAFLVGLEKASTNPGRRFVPPFEAPFCNAFQASSAAASLSRTVDEIAAPLRTGAVRDLADR